MPNKGSGSKVSPRFQAGAARCLASGSASISSSCWRIFFCGPRFFGAAATGAASCAISSSSVVSSVLAFSGQAATEYAYRIRACNGGGCGSWGQEMKVVSQGGGSLNPPGPGEP